MVSYLKIRSVSETNPVDMFTLGVSTARGVEGKIGQFGSGSLMATLLWLRLHGVSPIFVLNGVRVEFESRPEKTSTGGVFHRVFQTVDGVESPLSVALEYGELDWTNETMALREWVCNALDQDMQIDDCISKVDSLDCDSSEVCVFVPMNSMVRLYWQNIDKYFLHYSDRQDTVCIAKPAVSACRIYRKGVFVRELNEQTLFDYNLDIEINECRTGSSDSYLSKVQEVIDGDGGDKAYYDTLFNAIITHQDCYEANRSTSWVYAQWIDTLKEQASRGVRLRKDKEEQGYTSDAVGYPVANHWYRCFTNRVPLLCGYPDKVASENAIILEPAPPEIDALAVDCWKFLTTLLPTDKEMPSVHTFKTSHGRDPSFMGKYDPTQNRVLMWKECQTSRQIMLEELAHAISGCYDCTRSFQDYLFRLLNEAYSVIAD